MIIPFFNGILRINKVPVTWVLFILNGFFLVLTSYQSPLHSEFSEIMKDDFFIESGGDIFAHYIVNHQRSYNDQMKELAERSLSGEVDKQMMLGQLAVSDPLLTKDISIAKGSGDEVALKFWRSKMLRLQKMRAYHPSYLLGLFDQNLGYHHWLSYQFVHSGFSHFFVNMLMLLVIGSMLEPILGGLLFLLLYLLSGIVGALVFVLISGAGSVPLIGASGSISGIMACLAFLFWSRPVRYAYFLFIPKNEYCGFVYLPGWLTFAFWFLSDLAGYFGAIPEWGGVAYSAHLGGEMAGGVAALALLLFSRWSARSLLSSSKFIAADISSRVAVGYREPFGKTETL